MVLKSAGFALKRRKLLTWCLLSVISGAGSAPGGKLASCSPGPKAPWLPELTFCGPCYFFPRPPCALLDFRNLGFDPFLSQYPTVRRRRKKLVTLARSIPLHSRQASCERCGRARQIEFQ